MAKFNDKISTLINSQLPDFVVDDHPQFVQFLKTYFQFMESAELQITSIESNYVRGEIKDEINRCGENKITINIAPSIIKRNRFEIMLEKVVPEPVL